MKKEKKKKEKLTESLHLTVEITGSSNYKSLQNRSLTPCMNKIAASLKPQGGSTVNKTLWERIFGRGRTTGKIL